MKFTGIKEKILNTVKSKDIEQSLNECETIAERLTLLRKRTGLSRAKLSVEIGIEANMLNKYENGYIVPKNDRIKQFAEYYGVPEKYITGDASSELLKEDYLLVHNLWYYCWEINAGITSVENIKKLKSAILEADLIVIKCINNYNKSNESKSSDYMIYVDRIFSKDGSKIPFGDLMKDIYNLIEELAADKDISYSIEVLARIFDYGICTLDCCKKEEFRLVLKELSPLIESYSLAQ